MSSVWVLVDDDGPLVVCATEKVANEFQAADYPNARILETTVYDTFPDEVDVLTCLARWDGDKSEPHLPTRTTHKQRIELPPPSELQENSDYGNPRTGERGYWVRAIGTDKEALEAMFDEVVAAVIAERMGIA